MQLEEMKRLCCYCCCSCLLSMVYIRVCVGELGVEYRDLWVAAPSYIPRQEEFIQSQV